VIVLVDTCVFSLALRRSRKDLNPQQLQTLKLLDEAIDEKRVRLLGVVRQELLSGIRHREQFDRVAAILRGFEDVLLDIEDYEEAAIVDNACRSAGLSGSTTDFLICAVAARRNWAVFTVDQDFQRYQKQVHFSLITAIP